MESADDKSEPLTKPKKERSEKQKEAFEKAREARQKHLEDKKAQEKKQVLKDIKNELNGKETKKREDTNEDDFADVFIKKDEPKSNSNKKEILPKSDNELVYAEKSDDYEGSTEEEITVIKRKKKKSKDKKPDVNINTKGVHKEKEPEPKKERKIKKIIYESDSEAEEDSVPEKEEEKEVIPEPTTRQTKSQQNRITKNTSLPSSAVPRYYFGN